MAREFRLPDIGEGLTEAEIVSWLVAEGDRVEADQPIVEVETDKAVVEIPSPYAGVVARHGGAEGDTIGVGSVLVVIAEEGEVVELAPEPKSRPPQEDSVFWDDAAKSEPLPTRPVHEPPPIVGTLDDEPEVIETAASSEPVPRSAVKALPVVRKLARDRGVDIESIVGTGPGGRITREDVESAAGVGPVESPVAARPPEPPVEIAAPIVDERRSMTRLRRTIAANMSKSWAEVPHVTTFDDIDATRLLEVRTALGERYHTKIALEALVIKALLPALDEFPEFNATVDGDDLILHGARDIGVAVDTPDGLLVAVIRDAATMSVLELAAEVRRLGEGSKARTLTPGELTGQTFTVSNIGAVGGGHGTPIVPPGTTAILSVGRAQMKPVAYDGDIGIAPLMPLSLSYDHRVIDGGQGRRFMALLMENLEEPALFLAG